MIISPLRRRWRWRFAAASALGLACLLVACGSSGNGATSAAATPDTPVPPAALATITSTGTPRPVATGPAVDIANFNFVSANLTVKAGATVIWTNVDDVPHTVTVSDKSFNSGPINTNDQFSMTFTTPGTYSYFCAIHPFMNGKVIVQ